MSKNKNQESSSSEDVDNSTSSSTEQESQEESSSSSSSSEVQEEKEQETKEESSSSSSSEENEATSSSSSSSEENEATSSSSSSSEEEKEVKSKKTNDKTVTKSSNDDEDLSASVGKTVFMKNFGPKLTREEITEALEKFGPVAKLVLPSKRDSSLNRGFLLCHFENRESVDEALKLNGQEFLNCKIYVEEIKDGLKTRNTLKEESNQKRQERGPRPEERCILFVGNLPYELDEHDFKKYIEEQGNIRGIRIPQDKETGRKRGFAFFEFDSKDDMKKMMKKDLVWDERRLNMSESNQRDGDKRDDRRSNFKRDGDRRDNFKRDGDRRDNFRRGGDRRDNDFKKGGDRRNNDRRDGDFKRNNDRYDNDRRNNKRSSEDRKENSKKIKFDDSSE